MKFTARHAPDSLELLNLRQSIISEACRHCGCRSAMTAHGFLKGISVSGVGTDTRGLRFLFQPLFASGLRTHLVRALGDRDSALLAADTPPARIPERD
ncbi:hypothetical protein OJ996_14270 [Luteolibacter sp. GHJ8]|uniref:Uncharacterized protein n=1 Tax=Luteolibacter rhizosphaerae TaxID=2989719 RepID=A0ABT3G4H1_9BACT|nr:hypothetical protein [Luteolibacter rhizosphaerae]MCW1914749.1 hypothetical protein [Luteolibacter rhizosphaerae]